MRPAEQYREFAAARRPGRRRHLLTTWQQSMLRVLHQRHPGWGLPTLRQKIPGLPKNSATHYLRRLDRVLTKRRRRRRCRLLWSMHGAVWAIDGTWLDRSVAPLGRRALVVVEMHSRGVLCLQSVPGERAVAAEQVLADLIARHGAPLVLKLDNGSAFTAKRFKRFCWRHGILLLHSPVRRPSYNGTCEVSGKWAKGRAEAAWSARGGTGPLTQADLDAAATFQGTMPRIDSEQRRRFQQLAAEHLVAVAQQRGLVLDSSLRDHVRRSLERVAIRRALIQSHILTIEGLGYHQCLPVATA